MPVLMPGSMNSAFAWKYRCAICSSVALSVGTTELMITL